MSSKKKSQMNKLYYGDNLEWMRDKDEFPTGRIDLIYLDPPFNSKKAYNIIYDTGKSKAQVKAFDDTWNWNREIQKTYNEILQKNHANNKTKKTIKAFHDILGDNNLMAYLVMMTPRIIEMHRILKDTGSIYLHCDPTASHYLKMLMDGIFGKKNFQNEIIWHYTGGGRSKSYFSRKHDVLLMYSKSDSFVFNGNNVRIPYKETSGYAKSGIVSKSGKKYLPNPNGKIVDDVWDIPIINPMAKERTGYPTQKPEALLERIIKASCPENGIVFDPFAGCGTALITAEKLGRKWQGIDVTYLAVDVLRQRIKNDFGSLEDVDFEIKGEPKGMAGAKAFAKKNKSEFQKWIISKIGGTPSSKMSGDKGIDGHLWFVDDNETKTALIQETVSKGVSPSKVRDFMHTVSREEAPAGIFITMKQPTKGMREEAAKVESYKDNFLNEYPTIQFLTVQNILDGKNADLPQIRSHMTKRNIKKIKKKHKQSKLKEEVNEKKAKSDE